MDAKEKLVKKAISHFWYGVSHDIFSEPVTTYAKLAIEALEKENGVTVQMCKLEDKKTNADRIRNMTNEELVVFLDGFSSQCIECAEYGKNESCPIYKEGHYCRPQEIMEWLQQPAEENDYD